MSKTEQECKHCGNCCRHLIIDEISDIDIERAPRLKPYVEEFRDEPGRYLLKSPCPFLFEVGNNEVRCDIYPTRPNICIAFEPGSHKLCPLFSEPEKSE